MRVSGGAKSESSRLTGFNRPSLVRITSVASRAARKAMLRRKRNRSDRVSTPLFLSPHSRVPNLGRIRCPVERGFMKLCDEVTLDQNIELPLAVFWGTG